MVYLSTVLQLNNQLSTLGRGSTSQLKNESKGKPTIENSVSFSFHEKPTLSTSHLDFCSLDQVVTQHKDCCSLELDSQCIYIQWTWEIGHDCLMGLLDVCVQLSSSGTCCSCFWPSHTTQCMGLWLLGLHLHKCWQQSWQQYSTHFGTYFQVSWFHSL